VVVTALVVVLPIAVVWWLRAGGVISSPWVCVALALALSLAASIAGGAYWKRRRSPRDLLFSELLLWGWLRRLWIEHQVSKAIESLSHGKPRNEDAGADRSSTFLTRLAAAVDALDPYTDGHSRRVAHHSVIVARRMGLSGEQLAKVRTAAAVHDVGKLYVPPEVLNKPGRLTSAEYALIKRHADVGADMVAALHDPEVTAIVRHHHERVDGTGYPAGLLGEHVPVGARIIAVADTFDAITSTRPYRAAAPHKQAIDLLVDVSGTQLDPVAVRAFLRCYSGNRLVVFWSLLAASPLYALAWLRDKAPGPANASFSSLATTIAAAGAIGAAAIGTSIAAGPAPAAAHPDAGPSPQLLARTIAPSAAVASIVVGRRHRAARRAAAAAAPRHGATPSPGATFVAAPVAGGGPRPGHAVTGGSAGAPAGGGAARGSSGGHGGSPAPGGGRGGGNGAGAPGNPGSGSGTATGAPQGSVTGSGSGSGTGSGGTGGGSGSGPGGGPGAGGSAVGPTTKAQCMGDGYAGFGFRNQGQCVSSVEPAGH
jgi:HD-GYP domain-containing protein (c-di-GMP phosphodiesterase class II)